MLRFNIWGLNGPASAMLALTLACATPALAEAQPQASAAEAQLEQIRQAIVNAAAEQPTQVLSTAWIDSNGQLHETAHFQTDAEVRSIRMPLFQDKNKPVAKPSGIKVELLPSAWRQKAKPDAQCEEPKRTLRQPLKIFLEADAAADTPQAFHRQATLDALMQQWQNQVRASRRWWPQAQLGERLHGYEAALTADTDTPSAWAVRLSLKARPTPAPTPWYKRLKTAISFEPRPDDPVWLWQLSMTAGALTQDGRFEPHWSRQLDFGISPGEQMASANEWQATLNLRLKPIMEQWAKDLDKAWACEPVQFQVADVPGSGLYINSGLQSGLNPGDRLLLVAPEYIPQKIMENGAMSHLRLAEVVRVGKSQTSIRQIAGPQAPSSSRLLALPL